MSGWSRKKWLLLYLFVAIVGTLWHFVHNLTGENRFVGYFFPINESTWEHMKLVYFPMLLCMAVFVRKFDVHWLLGNLIGTWLIPVIFYTYNGILGFGVMALDIINFYVSVLAAFVFVYKTLNAKWSTAACMAIRIGYIAQGILFIACTYNPLTLGIFAEP